MSSSTTPSWAGLSPRVRGNHRVLYDWQQQVGSIPACAGEPCNLSKGMRGSRVYPRVCGGTGMTLAASFLGPGLSPRVRGNRPRPRPGGCRGGSIPACAGEPNPQANRPWGGWVYPRVCGGTIINGDHNAPQAGLSPRVRGNHRAAGVPRHDNGSIPACAGEPGFTSRRLPFVWVYPRVCGGTGASMRSISCRSGLSPRVRGNRRERRAQDGAGGSIPACAGGTKVGRLKKPKRGGLSPRVRGNRAFVANGANGWGSIPACAGEPFMPASFPRRGRVYPRVCGGTSEQAGRELQLTGLSPRVRGNLRRVDDQRSPAGSIPACAGEPVHVGPCVTRRTVYPRVCGGTTTRIRRLPAKQGLSPRVRGNLRRESGERASNGSIPACAGNLVPSKGCLVMLGSIPACAGEPVAASVCPATIKIRTLRQSRLEKSLPRALGEGGRSPTDLSARGSGGATAPR